MNNLLSFNEFLTESSFTIESEKGTPKLSKVDDEILQIALKGLPKNVVNNIKKVEGHGAWSQTFESPVTLRNKARNDIEYSFITLYFSNPIGKMTELYVGIRKRTSGPGTGYLVLVPISNPSDKPYQSFKLLDTYHGGVATEFFDNPETFLKKLYDTEIKPKI